MNDAKETARQFSESMINKGFEPQALHEYHDENGYGRDDEPDGGDGVADLRERIFHFRDAVRDRLLGSLDVERRAVTEIVQLAEQRLRGAVALLGGRASKPERGFVVAGPVGRLGRLGSNRRARAGTHH